MAADHEHDTDAQQPGPTYEAAQQYSALVGSPNASDDRMAATERLLGLAADVRFEDAVAEQLAAETGPTGDIGRRRALLEAQEVSIDPAIAPPSFELEKLSEQDWEVIKTSKQPLLTLHAASNYRREEADTTFVPVSSQFPRHLDPRQGYEGLEKRARIASLPLVHGLSAAAFEQLAQSQVMQSNKTRYKKSGADALAFHGAGVGATNLQDRQLGLDQYVFFDFGRPAANHRQQPEITLVVDPSVMDQNGTFMTTTDIADATSVSEYMRGLTTPQYFRETALLRIHNTVAEEGETRTGGHYTGYAIYNTLGQWHRGQNGDFRQDGYPKFSTYEVKVPDPPGVPTAAIQRVIVRDPATFERLQQSMGDLFEFVHEPRLRAAGGIKPHYEGDPRDLAAIDQGNYPELLQIPGAFEREMENLIEVDYQRRSEILDGLSEDEKEQVIAVFGDSDPDNIDGEDIPKRISTKTNPYQYNGLVATYPNMEALLNDIENTDTRGMTFSTAAGQQPWFHDSFGFDDTKRLKTTSGRCVIATIERSKQDPGATRIIDTRDFSLDEVVGTA